MQLVYTATGLTAGAPYQFKYRVKNTYGWSPYSNVLLVYAADPPDIPAQPTSQNTGTSVRLDWIEPYNGGSAILELDIEVRASDGTFKPELIYCNGVSDTTVRAQSYCVIPISVLTSSPYNLVQGNSVVARMRATNVVGSSNYSIETEVVNVSYADIRTVPHKPPNPPTRGPASSTSQIEVVIAPLTGVETGGDAILSYRIQWDQGTPGTWADLQGWASNSLDLSVITTGLTITQPYQYRYKARNIFGWSADFSDPVTIATVTEPFPIDALTVGVNQIGTNIQVTWSEPDTRGSPVIEYELLFADNNGTSPGF